MTETLRNPAFRNRLIETNEAKKMNVLFDFNILSESAMVKLKGDGPEISNKMNYLFLQ